MDAMSRTSQDDVDLTLPGDGPARPAGESAMPGQLVGRYIVTGELGAGSMGTVYRAYDPELERDVALKLIDRLPRGSEKSKETFLAEARLLAKLSSPFVVSVFDVGMFDGRVFIAMELVAGPDLQRWLERTRTRSQILAMFTHAGRGLSDAHAAGIVHGDFKPDNVMVDAGGRPKVLDFGLAQAVAPSDSSTNLVSKARGTPRYMAPELFEGGGGDFKSDQFAFCVALWEALAGQPPYEGGSLPILVASVTEGSIVPMPKSARVAGWLDRALRRGLSRQPADRWPSMQALLDELTRPRALLRRTAAVVAVVGTVSLAWVLGSQNDPRAQCERRLVSDAPLWSDERSTRVRQAILEVDLPFADQTATRVVAALGDYDEDLRATSVDACVLGLQGSGLDRRGASWCLEARRLRFDALASTLLHVDAESVQHAVRAIESLPPVVDCLDELRVVDPGITEDQNEQALEVEKLLSQAAAAANLGRNADAQQLAAEAVRLADTLGSDALTFESRHRLATQMTLLERYDEADVLLRGTYELALKMGSYPKQMDVALSLASLHGPGAGDLSVARQWQFVAGALLGRPEIDDWTRARFHTVAALIDQADRKTEQALDHRIRELEIRRRVAGEEATSVARAELRMSHLLRIVDRSAEALVLQQHADRVLRAGYGENHPEVAEAANAMALTHLDMGDSEAAAAQFETALEIWTASTTGRDSSVAFALVNLCRVRADENRLEEALQFCTRAVDLRQRRLAPDHPVLAYTRSDRADILRRLGRLEESRVEAELALRRLEHNLGADHPNLGDVLTVLGRTLVDLEEPAQALPFLRRALAARTSAQYEHVGGETAATLGALALALDALGQDKEAKERARQALDAYGGLTKTPGGTADRDAGELRRRFSSPPP